MPQETDSDAVKISATIGTLQTRVSYEDSGVTNFTNGDAIKVTNTMRASKSEATYTTTDGVSWTTTDAFVWNGGIMFNQFRAWYPATASYERFTLPTNQSFDDIGNADWMTASTSEITKPDDCVLNLTFQHRLAKVTVNIAQWNNEFEGADKTITEPKIYTKGTDIIVDPVTGVCSSNSTLEDIEPLVKGTSFTAIVAPLKYGLNDTFMTFKVAGQKMTVLATASQLTNGLESGNHYTFNLTVGKNAVEITEVKVTDWNKVDLNGGVAKECEHETTVNNAICATCGAHLYVDLGLSVNWATVNIGATKPEEAGDFFAWGETEPKDTYNWSTYKWCYGSKPTMTKYCTNSSYGYNGFTDNLAELELADDAAAQNWGDGWMMPSIEQIEELLDENKCAWTWTTVNGVTGYQITSKVSGYEGNCIFLPFALHKDDISQQPQNRAAYWTRTLNEQEHFGYVYGFNSYNYDQRGYSRSYGCLIRPVREK